MKYGALLLFFISLPAWSMDLKEFLGQVKDRHEGYRALQLSIEAAESRRLSGDRDLIPVLTLKGSQTEDKKQPNFLGATNTKTTTYTLGLNKKFSTGTAVGLSASALGGENEGIASSTIASAYGRYGQGSLGVSVAQSLWKDFFGQATSLRRERESLTAQMEKGNFKLQEKQLLVDAEAAYWDYIYLQEEARQGDESLKRAQKIEAWVRRRVSDGIGDRADLLNAQALVASRQLQVLNSQDQLVGSQKKIKDLLAIGESEGLPELKGQIDLNRKIELKGSGKILRIDAYLSALEARTRKTSSLEIEDSLKSDLVLAGAYNTNSYEANGGASEASKSWTKTSEPTSTISLTWTYMFDGIVKQSAQAAANKEALAAENRRQRKFKESELAWQELLRRHDELGRKVEALRVISRLQSERSKAEQDKLSKGRSITTNVINAEQDAAEAELNLVKLMIEQRKLETQSQMFILAEEI